MTSNLFQTTPPSRDTGYHMVQFLRKNITFNDFGTEVVVGKLPARSIIVGGGVHIITAFNSSGTDLLDIGFKSGSATDDPNGLATALSLAAVGYLALDELAATTNIMSTSDVLITCSPAQSVADATAGEAEVVIFYVPNR